MKELFDNVKEYKEFLTVDELDDELRRLCDINEILNLGVSEDGHKILCARLGNGKNNALIFGAPHPNEPIGCLTSLELIKIIKSSDYLRKKYTWYIVPCSDPDGVILNEPWFKGKFSIKKYAYGYYRSPSMLQSEWSFPIKYKKYTFNKSPKQNDALRKLIDKIKPKINYPLHNAGFSGAFFLLSHKMPKTYYSQIKGLCKRLDVPLDNGDEMYPFMKKLDDSISIVPFFEQIYDFLEENGQKPWKTTEGGQPSIDYVKKLVPDMFGVVGEIPYMYDKKVEDKSKISKTRREVNRKKLIESTTSREFILDVLKLKGINKKSPFYTMLYRGAHAYIREQQAKLRKLKDKKYSAQSTVAEEFTMDVMIKFYIAINLGALHRLLEDSKKTKELIKLDKEVKKQIERNIKYVEKKSKYKIIPIKNLIKIQIGCLFYALKYL
jgi:hypothetical protein